MIRVGTNIIIFLLNNAEYVIEEQIHPGPYNKLQNWDYCALAHAMKGESDNLFTAKVISHSPIGCNYVSVLHRPLLAKSSAYAQAQFAAQRPRCAGHVADPSQFQ